MLRLAGIAAVGAVAAAAAAHMAVSWGDAHDGVLRQSENAASAPAAAPAPTAALASVPAPAPADGETAQLTKAADGHYWAEATVDGQAVRFLVDTGASAVALTTDDAQRLGFTPQSLNYTYEVSTANGLAHAAKVKLASVSVSGAEVRDVDAFVIDKGLPISLLGMTYLGRLSQFSATQTSLILRP